jgi:hypothetical protein
MSRSRFDHVADVLAASTSEQQARKEAIRRAQTRRRIEDWDMEDKARLEARRRERPPGQRSSGR